MTKEKGKPMRSMNNVGKGPNQEQLNAGGWRNRLRKGKAMKGKESKGKGKGKREKELGKEPAEHGERKRKRQRRTEIWREGKRSKRTEERKRDAVAGRMRMLLKCNDEVDFWWLMNFEQLISKVRVFQKGDKNSAPPV